MPDGPEMQAHHDRCPALADRLVDDVLVLEREPILEGAQRHGRHACDLEVVARGGSKRCPQEPLQCGGV